MKTALLSQNNLRLFVIAAALLVMAVFDYSGRVGRMERVEGSALSENPIMIAPDAAKARAAFKEAVKVFFSARCANCHPAGDAPTQGDSLTTHSMEVKRGPDGRGVNELKCTTCHQDINLDGDSMPPGAPDWHMPPADQKMVFQGISAGQLCRNLKDPLQNGGRKSAKDAVQHIAVDPKVLWAWSPGNGRTTPPMTHADFMKKMNEWVANGAACPE